VTAAALLAALLFYAALTLWVPGRWAWSLFQVGVFLLAGWRVGRARSIRLTPAAATLAVAALWPLAQVAAGSSVDGGETWMAALNWATFLVVFLVAADILRGRRERHWFLGAISLGGMIVAAAAVLQDYSSAGKIFWLFPSGYTEGVLGPFVNRNQYAAWVELLLPAALYLAATARRRALYGTAAAILLGSVIAGASRAGSALAVGEVFAVALALAARHANPRRAVAMWAAQFACFAAIAIAVVGWQGLRDRLGAPGTEVAARGCGARLARHDPRPSLDGQRAGHLGADVPALRGPGHRPGGQPGAQRLGAMGGRRRLAVPPGHDSFRRALMQTRVPVDIRAGCGRGPAACSGGLPDAAAARAGGLVVRHGRRGVGAWSGGERRI
jgi:hypothetical protein